MGICKFCDKEFTPHPSRKPKEKNKDNQKICGSCDVRKRRWQHKIRLIKKLGGKCERCGYDKHPAALQFHHKDPSTKLFEIHSHKLLVKGVDKEVEKCILLCANCHSIEHTNEKVVNRFGLDMTNLGTVDQRQSQKT